MLVDVETTGANDLDRLTADCEFKPYRNYRILSRTRQADVMRAEIREALGSADAMAFGVRADGFLSAAVVFKRLPWDSGFFDVPMGRVTHLLRAPQAPGETLSAAIRASLQYARSMGVAHVTARADVADTDAIGSLEAHGFRLMDALVTYIIHPRRDLGAPVKEMGLLRHFRPEDTPQILDITREAFRGFRGRFHMDPHLPDDRCDEFYVEWARNACAHQLADVVLVTEGGHGEIHGWTSYRQVEPVSTAGGTPVCGAGLGGCRRKHPGAYAGLIRGATEIIHKRGGVTECQTQIHNFPTIRVYEAVGTQYVRADYTFHAWLE